MKINRFDRPSCRRVREAVEKALAEIAGELGVTFGTSGGRFSDDQFTFKVTANAGVEQTADGNTLSLSESEFVKNAVRFGLQPDDLGKRFRIFGKEYKITGAKPSRYKYPINVEGPQGGRYKMSINHIKSGERLD